MGLPFIHKVLVDFVSQFWPEISTGPSDILVLRGKYFTKCYNTGLPYTYIASSPCWSMLARDSHWSVRWSDILVLTMKCITKCYSTGLPYIYILLVVPSGQCWSKIATGQSDGQISLCWGPVTRLTLSPGHGST